MHVMDPHLTDVAVCVLSEQRPPQESINAATVFKLCDTVRDEGWDLKQWMCWMWKKLKLLLGITGTECKVWSRGGDRDSFSHCE